MNGLRVEGKCPDLFLRHHANNQVGVAKKRTENGALRDAVHTLFRGVLYTLKIPQITSVNIT